MRFLSLLILSSVFASIALSSLSAHAQSIKNQQAILGGALTRAGNSGMSQLTDSELTELCENGYTHAYFLYTGATARTVNCSRGSIVYKSQSFKDIAPIMSSLSEDLATGGKTFVHCFNGAHASGLVAAIALRQFCGYSGAAAFDYWKKTVLSFPLDPGATQGVANRISSYRPVEDLVLSDVDRARICN